MFYPYFPFFPSIWFLRRRHQNPFLGPVSGRCWFDFGMVLVVGYTLVLSALLHHDSLFLCKALHHGLQ
jgi:hypothetical protein